MTTLDKVLPANTCVLVLGAVQSLNPDTSNLNICNDIHKDTKHFLAMSPNLQLR